MIGTFDTACLSAAWAPMEMTHESNSGPGDGKFSPLSQHLALSILL